MDAMHIEINWAECPNAISQQHTQQAIDCVQRLYGPCFGYADMHPLGEYVIVHLRNGYRTHSYGEMFAKCNYFVPFR